MGSLLERHRGHLSVKWAGARMPAELNLLNSPPQGVGSPRAAISIVAGLQASASSFQSAACVGSSVSIMTSSTSPSGNVCVGSGFIDEAFVMNSMMVEEGCVASPNPGWDWAKEFCGVYVKPGKSVGLPPATIQLKLVMVSRAGS